MAVIYCPQCDSEIPESVAICPSCGFNLDTYDENSSEFNALLNAANKKLSEDSGQAETATTGSGSISQSQIDALLDGNVVDLTSSDEEKPVEKKPSGKPVINEEIAGKNAAEKVEKAPEPVPEKKSAPVEEAAAAPVQEPVKKVKSSQNMKERKPPSPMFITIAAAVVAAALGFCVSLLIFGDISTSPEEAFAIKAANAVNSKLNVNQQLCVYKAYVKLGSAADECILYAITDYKDEVSASKYRVVVSRNKENVINIYYTIDENSPEYLAMKESEDPELRVQASVLKNYSDTIENAHREISIGKPEWVSVDISEINSNITSKQNKTVQE